jgi:hypothetical protein
VTEPRDPFEEWLTRQPVEPLSPHPGLFDRIDRSARRRRWAKAAGAAASVLVLITGLAATVAALQAPDHAADSRPTAAGSGPSIASPSLAPTSPTASATADRSPAAQTGAARCTAGQLHLSVAPGNNASGHIGLILVFTNTSTTRCTMYGYPGVSFVTGPSGTQINDPAQRSAATGPPATVTLAPHGTAHANLLLVNVANYPADLCQPTQAAGIRVYPPDDTTALFVNSPQQICTVNGTGLAQIYPIQTGNQ